VGGQDDDGAGLSRDLQSLAQRVPRRVVESSERLVEQQQARLVDQRTLERELLRMPAEKPATRSSRRFRQAACASPASDASGTLLDAVYIMATEREVFGRR
jgi:hypothetical protein